MRISRSDRVAGQPIKQVRDFLRRLGFEAWSKPAIAEFFEVAPSRADVIIKEMLVANMIERSPREWGDGGRAFYKCGETGARLRNARLLKPITRAKAEILVAQLRLRVADVNANDDLLYAVNEVRIFGSYIEPRDELGDIDLAVQLRPKLKPGPDWVEQLLSRADQSGKRFSSYLDRLFHAETEVLQVLKARCPYLAFHPMDNLQQIGASSQVLFEESEQPNDKDVTSTRSGH